MKLKNSFLVISMILMIVSCNDELETSPIDNFDVTADATTLKVGQEAIFKFTGDIVHHISFYSGELQKEYKYNEGRIVDVAGKGAKFSFSSSVQTGTQTDQLAVLVSNDFNGDYSSLDKVKAAKWTDLTSKFILGTTTAFTASGAVDISDQLVEGNPVYIAFKYVTRKQKDNGLARNWFIQGIALTSLEKLQNTTALNLVTQDVAGFRIVDQNPVNAPALSAVTLTRLSLLGNKYKVAEDPIYDPTNSIYDPTNPIYDPFQPLVFQTLKVPVYVPFDPNSPYNDPVSEHWAISKAIAIDSVNLGPDRPVAIKAITNPPLLEYRYIYTKAGTYIVTFVAGVNTIDYSNTVVKELTITVTE